MKSTKSFLAAVAMVVLLFPSGHVEAKNNYSNKTIQNEDKVKGQLVPSFMPSFLEEDTPELPAQKTTDLFDKYTPEQLNKIMGVWPERRASTNGTQLVSLDLNVQAAPAVNYTPEQLADLLGIRF